MRQRSGHDDLFDWEEFSIDRFAFWTTAVFNVLARIYVVMWFWEWFLVPALGGPGISFLQAAGVIGMAHAAVYRYTPEFQRRRRGRYARDQRVAMHNVIDPIGIGLAGWMLHGCMLVME
jgi:hypothetical protein